MIERNTRNLNRFLRSDPFPYFLDIQTQTALFDLQNFIPKEFQLNLNRKNLSLCGSDRFYLSFWVTFFRRFLHNLVSPLKKLGQITRVS